jgi:hypothetical protein
LPPEVTEEARRFRDQTRIEQIQTRIRTAIDDTDPQRGKDRLRSLRFDAATSADFLEALLHEPSALPGEVQQLIEDLTLDIGLAKSMAKVKDDLRKRCEVRAKNFARGTYRLAPPEMRDDYLAVATYLRQVLGGPHWSHGVAGPFDLRELEPWLLRFANGDLSFISLPSTPVGPEATEETDGDLDWSLNAEPDGLLFATLPEFLLAVSCLHEGAERREWFDAYVVALRAFEVMLARYAPPIGPRDWFGFDAERMHRAVTPPVDAEQRDLVRERLPLLHEVLAPEEPDPAATSRRNGYVNHILSLHGALIWSALRDRPTVKLSTAAPPPNVSAPNVLTLEEFAESLKPASPPTPTPAGG